MMYLTALFLIFLLQISLVDCEISNDDVDERFSYPLWSVERSQSTNVFHKNTSCLICNVAAGDIQFEGNQTGKVDEFLACMTDSSQEPDGTANQVYSLDQLPKAFVRQYKKQLFSGNSRICIHQGRANRRTHQVVIPTTGAIQILPGAKRRRRLYPNTGRNTVLVVRVTSTFNETPGLSASQLEGAIFGSGPNAQRATLTTQLGACSQNKWNLVPATGNNIVNGVLEVQYTGQVAGKNINGGPLQSAINQLVLKSVGVSKLSLAADHILFCLPPGSVVNTNNAGWIAFSYLGNIVSYFQRQWCQSLSAQVHEVGHQIGFRHSGIGANQYGDQSCVMGASYFAAGQPQECFNGHKNWLSGWFEDRKVTIDPLTTGPWAGNLVAFVDYPLINQVSNGVVIIKVGWLYIQLNSAKKYNFQVKQKGNQVTVVENNATAMSSDCLVGLVSGQTYTYANYSGTGIPLVIQICSLIRGVVDVAKVSLHLLDGVQKTQCALPVNNLPVAPPTPPPTSLPPTFPPTKLPTKLPTTRPTFRPTTPPTPRPTTIPTFLPTSNPSAPVVPVAPVPVEPVTPPPTALPTRVPTKRPTIKPTKLPTKFPTKLPTVAPFTTAPIEILTSAPIPIVPPTVRPTVLRTLRPTLLPTLSPSLLPTLPPQPPVPRRRPTPKPRRRGPPPTIEPTGVVTTTSPTGVPTVTPIAVGPTVSPTGAPTGTPTGAPTGTPTGAPTGTPTGAPTGTPTVSPV